MYNTFWKGADPAALPGLTLLGIWQVEGDETYVIHPAGVHPGGVTVAIRTVKGRGILKTSRGRDWILPENSLVFLSPDRIVEYRTDGPRWDFFWFELRADPRLMLPAEDISVIPLSAQEQELIRSCCLNLGVSRREVGRLCQADFQRLVYGWLAALPQGQAGFRADLLGLLEAGDREGLSIPETARRAGMSQRSFRDEIHRLTGVSPTEYLTRRKMDTALQLLRSTGLTVQQVSERLGFCNPFYFSRVFRRHFGISPGQARRRLPPE